MKLALKHVRKVFNPGEFSEVAAVRDISLTFSSGENVVVEGPNGSGKSTLLFLIDGRISLTSGDVFLNGDLLSDQPPHKRSKRIFRLFQDSTHGIVSMGTIAENMALARTRGRHRSWFRPLVRTKNLEEYSKCVEKYRPELADHLDKKVFTASPGERQGLVLSILSIQGTESEGVLLADEPTASLDPLMAAKCIETIGSYADRGWICISVTHDRDWISRHRGRSISMEAGSVLSDTCSSEIGRAVEFAESRKDRPTI